MKKLKLCNVHKMALANEGEERKPIFIPFGTWDYDDTITQTLDKPHAEGIAAELARQIAAGEPGIPVYQGHPDVPEYAGKYPDKGAMGWVKKILVNEDGMECHVEWDRDPGKGFGWFSPYWVGDRPSAKATGGKQNVVIDGLTSIGLVNNPNIREFRLANEAGKEEDSLELRAKSLEPGEENNLKKLKAESSKLQAGSFQLPEHLVALAKKFDERRAMANVVDANGHGHGADGKFDGSGSGGGGGGKLTGKKRSEFARSTNDALQSVRDRMKNQLAEARVGKMEGWNNSGTNDAMRKSWSEITNIHKQAILAGLKYSKTGHTYDF